MANTRVKTKVRTSKHGAFKARPERSLEWLGGVSYGNLEKVLEGMKELLRGDKEEEIQLLVNSFGGVTGIGMSFYDSVKSVLKPRLTTIGSGDVDSSGVIVFLAGEKRYVTKNTTMLLHLGGRTLESEKRFSTKDLEQILKEDKLKDYQYACVVADSSGGRLTTEKVLDLMAKDTILTAEEVVNYGLAHQVLA